MCDYDVSIDSSAITDILFSGDTDNGESCASAEIGSI